MSNNSNYFKNPFRGRRTAIPEPYRPEHERLGVTAFEYPLKDPEEFEKMNKKSAEKNKASKKNKVDLIAKKAIDEFRDGNLSKEELEAKLHELYNQVPTQEIAVKPTVVASIPSSGQNEDLQWTQGLVSSEKKNNNVIVVASEGSEDLNVEEDEPDTEGLDFENAEEESVEYFADSIEDPPETPYQHTVEPLSDAEDDDDLEDSDIPEDPGFDLNKVKHNEYVLLYQNGILSVGSLFTIKETLSSIMDSDDKLSLEDFVVMKRVSVKMGIFIDE